MVLFFTSTVVNPPATIYMGRDKVENEDLIKYGTTDDVWFHVDKLSSAHVYLKLPPGVESWEKIPQALLIDCAQLVKVREFLSKSGDMAVGQVAFHNDKTVKRVHVAQRENAIVNRLNKTKVEREVDHEQEKIDRQKAESAVRRAAAVEQKKAQQELARQRTAEKEAKSYDRLFEGMDEEDLPQKSVQEMEDDFIAIDNATRGLINLGQLPVTCGLFFSLGHSTIVIVVNIAIAISTDVYNKIEGIGEVGGIIGASVSATFLFIIGLANSIILFRIIRERRRRARQQLSEDDDDQRHINDKFFMMRLLGPVTRFVDRPWKMYPVGVLFGFGSSLRRFDTASSIALLAVTAIAKRDSDGRPRIANGDIIILPLLFTAGMTFVDSADSILMLYSYAGVTESGFSLFRHVHSIERERDSKPSTPQAGSTESLAPGQSPSPIQQTAVVAEGDDAGSTKAKQDVKDSDLRDVDEEDDRKEAARKAARLKNNTMSKLSIILTLLSILVAFSISLITIMGLIGENCRKCREAAEAEDGGGLAGSWWRGWAKANDQSGWIGATIVGSFLLVVLGYYGGLWIRRKLRPSAGTDADA
ncbi:hypothetical protein FS837_004637 [Tulasnella sp. UAMH 9824]|nr:hypothetical protein FS837_004637 [Tulasnella sp. UAMH 9824]